jgi:hypothetical protein
LEKLEKSEDYLDGFENSEDFEEQTSSSFKRE